MKRGHSGNLLTVAELIEKLQRAPQDALVRAEGTETEGEVTGVDIDLDDNTVTLSTEAFHAAPWRRSPT